MAEERQDTTAPAIEITSPAAPSIPQNVESLSEPPDNTQPSPDPNHLARSVHIRNTERVNSPFQLDSPRMYESPPSPKTVMIAGQGDSPVTGGKARIGMLPNAAVVPESTEEDESLR